MIVYPTNWSQDYSNYISDNVDFSLCSPHISRELICLLEQILRKIDIKHLAYSGGIDSTILLSILHKIHGPNVVHTYTLASRQNHPDMIYARIGNKIYNTISHEIIISPNDNNVVEYLMKDIDTNNIICGDGIDEFMCGYYDHMNNSEVMYEYHLKRLLPDHLIPLDTNSGKVSVYLPYLSEGLIKMVAGINLHLKVDKDHRKKIIVDMATLLGIPSEIIKRNKYGFCDAFLPEDK